MTIRRSSAKVNPYGLVDADYDDATNLRIAGIPNGYSEVRGSKYGKLYYQGHGRFKYTPGLSSEEITVYGYGMKVGGPYPASDKGGFTDLTCTATKLTDKTSIATAKGTLPVKQTFRRAG